MSKLINYLFHPLSWIIIISIVSIFVKSNTLKYRLRICSIAMLLVFTNPFLINCAMRAWEVPGKSIDQVANDHEVIIVLGGAMRYYNNETLRPVYGSSLDRVMQGAVLLQSKKANYLLLSGGSGLLTDQVQKESKIVGKLLTDMGIDSSKLFIETISRNTYENAVESTKIITEEKLKGNILLVTSAYHMRRSMACFAKLGIDVEPFPVDQKSGMNRYTPDKIIIPDSESLVLWELLIHEWIGCISYYIMSYI
ncbi:MAG TPA: YdcF family protein [Bacteroidia bacterium]|nr:YdcF family protein [Bacteroidia bacterium]